MDGFVNRAIELAALQRWWDNGGRVAAVWGRRRVGKTTLVHHFSSGKHTIFHEGACRGELGELELLSQHVARGMPGGERNPANEPYRDWDEALDDLQARAYSEPILLVLDNFPDMLTASPGLADSLRSLAAEAPTTRLRVVLSGASVRQMKAMQSPGQPLEQAADLTLVLCPFTPHEAAVMLEQLAPPDRARVYGIVGGIPLYLSWWDTGVGITENLSELVCSPGARLLTEGDLLLRADLDDLGFNDRVLHALANGRTSYNDVRTWTGTEPARPLDRLIEQRLIERVLPVGEARQARRRRYRISDPFVRFHLSLVSPRRADIDRGLGAKLAPELAEAAELSMGEVWEEAFRVQLREMAETGDLPVDDVASLGPWWDNTGQAEIEALGLTGSGSPVLAGTVTWEASADASVLLASLREKVARGVGAYPQRLRYAVCARDQLHNVPYDVVGLTAADLFRPV